MSDLSWNHGGALALAGVAALGAEVMHWAGLPEWFAAALALVAIAISGIGTYHKGWIALRHGNLNINALMSIAVTGAVLLRQWPEAAMVMVLFCAFYSPVARHPIDTGSEHYAGIRHQGRFSRAHAAGYGHHVDGGIR